MDTRQSLIRPNTSFSYLDAAHDQRLGEIWNKTPGSQTISKFDYTYSAVGDIASWSQKAGASTPFVHSFGYDGVDQLLGDSVTLSGATQHQYSYRYDRAGNRTTEQIGSSVNSASYNNLNQLTSRGGNGQMTFEGTLSEPGTVAIAGGSPAPTDGSNHFRLAAPVIVGNNSLPIVATDASGNSTSNHIQLTVSGTTAQTLTYDLNGNMLSDGANTYEWDAANRLVAVNEPGNLRSEFTYNGLSQRVKIVEKTNGSVTSTKQFVWCPGDAQPSEERDASNNVTKRFYAQGEQIGSTNYYCTRNHLGSIRELTDSSGAVKVRYDYDPYGRRTRVNGSFDADFGFTGYYYHQPSGLQLALYRAYNADLGRLISRDPIGEKGGINLYGYVANNPINLSDPLGLWINWGTGSAAFWQAWTQNSNDRWSDPEFQRWWNNAVSCNDRYDIGANSNPVLPRTGPRSTDNSTAADRTRALGGDTGGFNITRYGYPGDPYTDRGTRLLLGNANNILNADSIALSPDVANRLGVLVGDPVIINGHFLGYYQDSTAANLTNRVDIYDPNGRGP